MPGFAGGGSFRVSGQGGIDSQLVAFRATPGEQVNIIPANQTINNITNNTPINVTIQPQNLDANFFEFEFADMINNLVENKRMRLVASETL